MPAVPSTIPSSLPPSDAFSGRYELAAQCCKTSRPLGHDAQHTSDVGLERAKDRQIWQHAKLSDLCIVTKDEDFVLLKASDPGGPCVVWVRIGNAVRRVIETRISAAWPMIVSKLSQGESVVELR